MKLGLNEKHVVVTGASQSIGRKIAKAFAAEGARVTALARRADKLAELIAEMGGAAAGHGYHAADLLPMGAGTKAAKTVLAVRGPVHVAVHCLGGTLDIRDILSPVEDWMHVWRYNVGIAIEMNAVLLPPMIERAWGRVIHISSYSAVDYRGCGPYAAAKAYVNAYVNVTGRELAPKGVVVCGLMPGAIVEEDNNWALKSRNRPEMVKDFLRHHQAIGRLGTTEEITPFILLLASELNTFATAAVLPIHGGAM